MPSFRQSFAHAKCRAYSLHGGFYHLRRFTEIKVSTTSELFSTTSELIPGLGQCGVVWSEEMVT
jgi:hypothetical protein